MSFAPGAHARSYLQRVFDVQTLELLWYAKGYDGQFDPGGGRVAMNGEKTVELRDARTGRIQRVLSFPRTVAHMVFAGPGRLAVVGDGGLLIIDAAGGRELQRFPIPPAGRPAGYMPWRLSASGDGRRVALGFQTTWLDEGCGGTYVAQVLDLPSGSVRCMVPVDEPTTALSAGGQLETSVGMQSLVVDTDSCRVIRRGDGVGTPSADGLLWLTPRVLDGVHRIAGLRLPEDVWQAGPRIAAEPRMMMSAGKTKVAIFSQAPCQGSVEARSLIHVHSSAPMLAEARAARGAAPQPAGEPRFAWHEGGLARWDAAAVKRPVEGRVTGNRLEDERVSIRVLPVHGGMAIEVTNRSPWPMQVDRARTAVTSSAMPGVTAAMAFKKDGGRAPVCLESIGCQPCQRRCDKPCLPVEVPPRAKLADQLWVETISPADNSSRLVDAMPGCGGKLTLELGLRFGDEKPTSRRLEMQVVCP